MNVIVTENGSPAKYADWDGVMATWMPASGSEGMKFGMWNVE